MPLPTNHVDRTLQPSVSNVSSVSGSEHTQSGCVDTIGLKPSKLAADITPRQLELLPTVISPDKSLSSDDSSHADTVSESDEFDASTTVKHIGKSDHKIEEERGFPVEEPLLKENPHRFVLFPIEDNEVRILLTSFVIWLMPCIVHDGLLTHPPY